MNIRDILAGIGTSVASNARDVPDESEEHVWCDRALAYEDALLSAIEDAVQPVADDRERGDDLRWERDLLVADARVACNLFGPDCESVRTLVAMARAVNHDLVYALRSGGAL